MLAASLADRGIEASYAISGFQTRPSVALLAEVVQNARAYIARHAVQPVIEAVPAFVPVADLEAFVRLCQDFRCCGSGTLYVQSLQRDRFYASRPGLFDRLAECEAIRLHGTDNDTRCVLTSRGIARFAAREERVARENAPRVPRTVAVEKHINFTY